MVRKIDDHGFWAGGASKGSPFPEGVKVKSVESAMGAGGLSSYRDEADDIVRVQRKGESDIKREAPDMDRRN